MSIRQHSSDLQRAARRRRSPGHRASSLVDVSGGAMWMRLDTTNGHRSCRLQAAANSAIGASAGPEALNGTSGSRVVRSRTSSIAQNAPRPRTSPIAGCRSCIACSAGPITSSPNRRARLDQALFLVDADARDRSRTGQRMAGIGQSTGIGAGREAGGDRLAHDHARPAARNRS